jgi:hypothetical protein
VNTASQFDHYMARAQEAQDQADKTKDPRIEETWRRIASNYRDLAVVAKYSDWKQRR